MLNEVLFTVTSIITHSMSTSAFNNATIAGHGLVILFVLALLQLQALLVTSQEGKRSVLNAHLHQSQSLIHASPSLALPPQWQRFRTTSTITSATAGQCTSQVGLLAHHHLRILFPDAPNVSRQRQSAVRPRCSAQLLLDPVLDSPEQKVPQLIACCITMPCTLLLCYGYIQALSVRLHNTLVPTGCSRTMWSVLAPGDPA